MKWDTIQLGEVMDVKHGYAFKSKFFADAGEYILLTPGNCYEWGGLKLKGDKEKYYTGEFPAEFMLNAGDMLVVMTDLINTAPILGGSFLIPEDNKFLHNQRLGLVQITDDRRIDKSYLYYLLNTNGYRAQIRGSASGATVRHTAPERIKACKVRVPRDVKHQRKIGEFLSAYDDLIENNRRRILLLEESARLLYKEWFVYLRFPGHEHVKVVDGVPEGCEKMPLDNALVLQRGFDLPSHDRKEGPIPIYASTGVNGTHSLAKVTGPGVVTGRSGSLGVVHYVHEDFWPLNTTLWVKEFKQVSPILAYFILLSLRLDQYNGGVSVPTLDRKVVHKISVIIPDAKDRARFDEYAMPIFNQVRQLRLCNDKLKQARDLLLPRLMNGEIEV